MAREQIMISINETRRSLSDHLRQEAKEEVSKLSSMAIILLCKFVPESSIEKYRLAEIKRQYLSFMVDEDKDEGDDETKEEPIDP